MKTSENDSMDEFDDESNVISNTGANIGGGRGLSMEEEEEFSELIHITSGCRFILKQKRGEWRDVSFFRQ